MLAGKTMIQLEHFIALVLATMLLLTVASCNKGELPQPRPPSSFVEEVNALVDAPRKTLGNSRSSIQAKLGPWSSIKTEKVANRHEKGWIDNVYTITYDGLVLSVYDVVAWKKEMLIAVSMTKNSPKILPEFIGKTEAAISEKFGSPARASEEAIEYVPVRDVIGEDVVRFKLRHKIVVAVEWVYYID
jgi:hypothetical protein